ncbi:MAG: hypothetical protein ACTSVC_00550 [Promethearchaeota archaeon]
MRIDPKNFIKGIFISKVDGVFLVSALFDKEIEVSLLSSFIAGLNMFGKETIGQIEEIIIKGLDLEIFVVQYNDLILTAIFKKSMKKQNIKEEALRVLKLFHERYQSVLNNELTDISKFKDFENILYEQIEAYFAKINENDKTHSFWDLILEKLDLSR